MEAPGSVKGGRLTFDLPPPLPHFHPPQPFFKRCCFYNPNKNDSSFKVLKWTFQARRCWTSVTAELQLFLFLHSNPHTHKKRESNGEFGRFLFKWQINKKKKTQKKLQWKVLIESPIFVLFRERKSFFLSFYFFVLCIFSLICTWISKKKKKKCFSTGGPTFPYDATQTPDTTRGRTIV